MEDVYATRARHGHYFGKAIWWIDHVLIDSKPTTLMIMIGERIIGDKSCYRIGNLQEVFFEPHSVQRDDIIRQGKAIIKNALGKKQITTQSGAPYDWNAVEPSTT
jgi:hypothetical protein